MITSIMGNLDFVIFYSKRLMLVTPRNNLILDPIYRLEYLTLNLCIL